MVAAKQATRMRWLLLLWLLALPAFSFPHRDGGLTDVEAAAHLLNRFAFGPRPGEVDQVVKMGLDTWVREQLQGLPEAPELESLPPEESSPWRLRQRKLMRAVYARNQMREVLADFWFNHFNVSLTDGDCRAYVADYEREAIRPHVLGKFHAMLAATARHPAMLYYLDNAYSVFEPEPVALQERPPSLSNGFSSETRTPWRKPKQPAMATPVRAKRGLNENYARELLELHTMGVDGGYRQADVTEVARAFTGWTVEKKLFRFKPETHDPRPKRILFTEFRPNGQAEGEKVLEMVSQHRSTARFLARKMAVRFVSEQPSPDLVESLSRTYLRTGGDLKAMVLAILESPEFWSRQAVRSKVKTPFELEASALRILDAKVEADNSAIGMLEQMGQELYECRPPTGFPDRADYWISPGNMLHRMSFAHQLAENRIRGVRVDLQELRPNTPRKQPEQALRAYAEVLLPGRDVKPAVSLLLSAADDPDYGRKVMEAARTKSKSIPRPEQRGGPAPVANLVGLLLGSPEFQRR